MNHRTMISVVMLALTSCALAAAMDKRIVAAVCWQGLSEWRPLDAAKYGTTQTGKPHAFAGPPIFKQIVDKKLFAALPVGSAWSVVAAMAPRPLLVCTTTGYGGLVRSQDSYSAVELSLPVYRFLGAEVEIPAKPETLGVGLHGKGPLRLHLANRGHTFDAADWKDWLQFLDEYFQPVVAEHP
jgi:hypothetical protein